LIGISAKEKLPLLKLDFSSDGNVYTYNATSATSFIRLIIQDESNYYVIEKDGQAITSMAIRKETVNQIIFLKP
jgi:hypothetical protein